MSNQQNPLLSTIFNQVITELKKNKVPKATEDLQKSLADLLKDVDFNNLHKEIPITTLFNSIFTPSTEESKEETGTVLLKDLVEHYSTLVNETFIHTQNRTKYVLLELLNVQSTDLDKFPVLVSYYDKQLKTKWCRPLVEFHSNFKLVQ